MRHLLIALIALSVAACGADTGISPSASIEGSYALKSVNGTLPYTVPGSTSTFVSSMMTLSSNGSWREQGTVRIVSNGQGSTATYDDQGTWTTSGSSITLRGTSTGAPTYTGTVSNASLVVTDGRLAFVFSK